MGTILLNLRYLLAPFLIIVAGAGVLIGGLFAWVGVILLFVGILVDIATKFESTGVGFDKDGEARGWATFQNLTMYFMLPYSYYSNWYWHGEFTLSWHLGELKANSLP